MKKKKTQEPNDLTRTKILRTKQAQGNKIPQEKLIIRILKLKNENMPQEPKDLGNKGHLGPKVLHETEILGIVKA